MSQLRLKESRALPLLCDNYLQWLYSVVLVGWACLHWEGRMYNHQGHHSRRHFHSESLEFHLSSVVYGPVSPKCSVSNGKPNRHTQNQVPHLRPTSADISNYFVSEYFQPYSEENPLPCNSTFDALCWCIALYDMNFESASTLSAIKAANMTVEVYPSIAPSPETGSL